VTPDENRYWELAIGSIRQHIDDTILPIVNKLDEHHETLYGNGKEGLKSEVQAACQTLNGHLEDHKESKEAGISVKTGGLIALISAGVAWIANKIL